MCLLAELPQLVPEVGELRWREWGRPPEPVDLSWWVAMTRREAGRAELPVTFVAVDAGGAVVGAVGLGEYDLAECRDRSPWVLGMVVRPDHRGRGVARLLLSRVERLAADLGYAAVWVATGPAAEFYRRWGWRESGRLRLGSGQPVVVLRKPCRPGITSDVIDTAPPRAGWLPGTHQSDTGGGTP